MAKPSRWSQWVVADSADPRIPMPWAVEGRVRNSSLGELDGMPGAIVSGSVGNGTKMPQHQPRL